jgi:hypothetical protein
MDLRETNKYFFLSGEKMCKHDGWNYNKVAILNGDDVIKFIDIPEDTPLDDITEMVILWCSDNGYSFDDNMSWEYEQYSS